MTTPENPADLFLQGWKNYQRILRHDYLWHGLANHALRRVLTSHFLVTDKLRFLDLACGDSAMTASVLSDIGGARVSAGYDPVYYVGVDSSPMALTSAERTDFGAGVRTSFLEADFVDFLRTGDSRFDVIYVGMSAHHLGPKRLPEFFAVVRSRLAPGGLFVAYEPFCLPDETRDEHIHRLHEIIRNFWIRLPTEGRDNVIAHTAECDFPVEIQQWNEATESAGLNPGRFAFRSPDRLYAMVVHEA